MNSADYIAKISQVKAGYLDGLWNGTTEQYEANEGIGVIGYTWANAYMLETIAILAGRGLANATDIARAQILVSKFVSLPCHVDNTWTHYMDGTGAMHMALDQPVAESLYYAWRYRIALGLPQADIDIIYNILTVDALFSLDIYDDGRPGHSLNITNCYKNQPTAKWKFDRLTYAVLAGATSWGLSASALLKRFVFFIDKSSATQHHTNLFSDFGWQYSRRSIPVEFPSAEYGQMCLGGTLIFLPEVWPYLNLTADEIAKLKAWQRHLVGQWQLDGYPNWDTIWSTGRVHSLSYWAWSLRALSGMVRGTNLLQNTNDGLYAKYLLDEAITTYSGMDTLKSDPADYAVGSFYFGIQAPIASYDYAKSSSNARFIMELALAIELGVADSPSQAPINLWTWGWTNKHVHVSTPYYSAGSLPKAEVIPSGYSGMDAVQLQHWGVSHIQAPRNIWLTCLGGYGREAFSFLVQSDGITEMDTAVTLPTTQNFHLDGMLQARTAYDLTVIPDTFSSVLRNYCSGQGTNYLVEVDTYFYRDHIRATHSATLTGTAGLGTVIHSFPCRKNVVIDYVSVSGAKTTVWNGTAITPAGSPAPSACMYIHLKWAQWNRGLLLIPIGGSVLEGAKVTALDYAPNSYPERQPDQDRSLLLYLADGAASMDNVSLTYDIYVTDGTNSDAERICGVSITNIFDTSGIGADIRSTDGIKAIILGVN